MKILLIEDDLRIAEFVSNGLKELGYSIKHAANGDDGLELALNHKFDLGIFDLMLPGLDGLSIIQRMRRQRSKVPVIILSAKRSLDDRVRGLKRGGDDYMTKPFSFSELTARVQAILRRTAADKELGPEVIYIGDLEINLLSRDVTRGGEKILLQPREFALLEFLAQHKEKVVSKTMIIEQVWKFNFDPQTNIVEARISKLREKIDKGFDMPLIHTVRGLGYVMRSA